MTAPIEKKKVSKPRESKKKVEVPVEEQHVQAQQVPSVESPKQEESDQEPESLETQLEDLKELVASTIKELNEKLKTFRTIETIIKKLGSSIKKELKSSKKKKSRKNSNMSSEHGFNAPVSISDELANFLGVSEGTKMRRPAVTSLISKYADAHNLKDEKNRGIFKPDKKLTRIFGPPIHPLKKDSDVKGYGIFNLQKYLSKHFIKETPAVTSV